MSDRTNITDEVQRKIDAIRTMDPADPDVSVDHGPCRLDPGEDAKLLLRRNAVAPRNPGAVG